MTSRSKDQKPDAVSLTKRRPQAFAKFNPRLFLTHRRAILLPPELHRIFFPKEENERLRCLCLSQSPAEHFSHILSSLSNFLFAEFFGQCLDLFYVLFLHSGHYFYIILCQVIFLLFSNMPFITFAAVGAQLPFSIRPMVRFWKLRSVRRLMKSCMNG